MEANKPASLTTSLNKATQTPAVTSSEIKSPEIAKTSSDIPFSGSIRIRSFRSVSEFRISNGDIIFSTVLLKDNLNIPIRLRSEDVFEIRYFLCYDVSVLRIVMTPSCARFICTMLDVHEVSDVDFIQLARIRALTKNSIIILLEGVRDDQLAALKAIVRNFKGDIKTNSISYQEASRIIEYGMPDIDEETPVPPDYLQF